MSFAIVINNLIRTSAANGVFLIQNPSARIGFAEINTPQRGVILQPDSTR